MNEMPPMRSFVGSRPQASATIDTIDVEQTVIGCCLVEPSRIPEAVTKVKPDEFGEQTHRDVMAVLSTLHGEGRTPSIEGVISVLGNRTVVENLDLREYLRRMAKAAVLSSLMPFADALEVLREGCQRRLAQEVLSTANVLMGDGGQSVADVAAETISRLDDVLAALRDGKRLSYDSEGAAEAAFDHLAGEGGSYAPTGLSDLDDILGGWPRGQLSVIAGRPGMGKSAAATCAVLRAGLKGFACQFFSLEMTSVQLGARLLCDLAYTKAAPINYEDILKRKIDDRAKARLAQARDRLKHLPIAWEEQRGLTVGEIAARARKHANQLDRDGQKLEVVFVDHMLLVRPSSRYSGNRVREVAEISDGLATLAKDLDVAVVALCQLNRGVEGRENKRPSLSDLRDSGAIEEDASTVTFLFRPAYYLENRREDTPEAEQLRLDTLEKRRHDIEYVVAKNRNGRIGVVEAYVDIGANVIRDKEIYR